MQNTQTSDTFYYIYLISNLLIGVGKVLEPTLFETDLG